jgi:hypothetical protein
MKCHKSLLLALSGALYLTACSGLPKNGGGGGGGGTNTLSLTLRADKPTAAPSIISFKATISGIALTPATGSAINLAPPALPVELMRLQSDSFFLGRFINVPSGIYSSITVSLFNPQITFLNNTGIVVSGCPLNTICTVNPTASGSPAITTGVFPLTLSSSGPQGLALDFNLSNSISVSGGNLVVTFTNTPGSTNVLSAVTLPVTPTSLAAGQLDFIEDFTGTVSFTGQTVTVTSPTRGILTATATSTTVFNPSPDPGNPICTTVTFSCVQANHVASIDAILKSDGTLALQEYEPLATAPQDLIEGTIVAINPINLRQFTMVVTDKLQALTSLIGLVNIGDLLTVTMPAVKPFLVDTKGLAVGQGFLNLFATQTDNTAMHLGQTVAIHPTAFVPPIGVTNGIVTADTVTLRFSRFTATTAAPFTTLSLNVINVPAYFNVVLGTFPTQTFLSTITSGSQTGSNYDGIIDPTGLADRTPVALRVLYLENSGLSSTVPFFAAKVRKPINP